MFSIDFKTVWGKEKISIAETTIWIAVIPEIITVAICFRGYYKTRYYNFLLAALTWSFLMLGNIFIAMGYSTLDFDIYRMGVLITAPMCFTIITLMDTLMYNHLDSRKLVIASIISTGLWVSGFEPGSIELNTSGLGDISPSLRGPFMIWGSLTFLIAGLSWLYYAIQLHRAVPESMKKYSKMNLLGSILAGPFSIIAFASGFVWYFPGTDYLFIGMGAFLFAYSLEHEPRLGYVLPFKAYRLIVAYEENSTPLFTHTWDGTGLKDSSLFVGALGGISALLRESIKKWHVKEMKFDEGTLLLYSVPKIPVLLILIASKTNKMLFNGLDLFARKFVEKYGRFFQSDKMLSNYAIFDDAGKIVEESFPFVVSAEKAAE